MRHLKEKPLMNAAPAVFKRLGCSLLATERLEAVTMMLAGVFMFSVMDAAMKGLSLKYGPFQLAFIRCAASLVVLFVPLMRSRAKGELRKPTWGMHCYRAGLGILMLVTFVYAVRRLSLATTYSVYMCSPLLITALSWFFRIENISVRRWGLVAGGLFGVFLILQPSSNGLMSVEGASAAVSATCYALGILAIKPMAFHNSRAAMVFWFLVLVGIGAGLLSIREWIPIKLSDWPLVAAVGFSGALGQTWVTGAFSRAPATTIAPFEYTSVLWAVGLDRLFWSVAPDWQFVVGASIIAITGILIVLDEPAADRDKASD